MTTSSSPPRILALESRRATETAELIRRQGGEPILAPSMREVPLEENSAIFDYLRELEDGRIDIVILMTGVGLRTLIEVAAPQYPRDRLIELFSTAQLVARGPKPVAVLRELGLTAQVTAPEPNTWRELLTAIDAKLQIAGKRIAVQEYGVSNEQLLAALRQRGAEVLPVSIYRWRLPEDIRPLQQAVEHIAAASVDAVLFTSATQVHHLIQVAADRAEKLRAGSRRVLVASIGPICSEALLENGLNVGLEASHPKLGHLVREAVRACLDRPKPVA